MICPLSQNECNLSSCAWWNESIELCSVALLSGVILELFKDSIRSEMKLTVNDLLGLNKKKH